MPWSLAHGTDQLDATLSAPVFAIDLSHRPRLVAEQFVSSPRSLTRRSSPGSSRIATHDDFTGEAPVGTARAPPAISLY